jgi:propionate CoA-transferase
MKLKKIVDAADAVAVIHDGDVVASAGYGGNGTPDQLFVALEQRFVESGTPRGLTLVFSTGQGDMKERGLNRLAHEGLVRRVIGGYFGLSPRIENLIVENRIEAYNLPEGVLTQMYRDIGAGKPGTLSRVGLGTYIDPRQDGGRMNERTTEDLVRLMEIDGEPYLFYRAFPINVALIRGTTADPEGNITTERESLALENLALAIAARNSGGIVLAQVERIGAEGSLDARRVKVPGVLVDCVVLAEPRHHMQTYGTQFNPAFSGELRIPQEQVRSVDLSDRKIIARRALLELTPYSVINVGVGSVPDQVPLVAGEERVQDLVTLTVDPGIMGGIPASGLDFGAAVNYQAVIDHCSAFDFIDGGGLDAAFLGFGECDASGNVNASRFGKRMPGCGGFIDITQNAKKLVFVGNFASSGLELAFADDRITVTREGKFPKFVERIAQITFSAEQARLRGQEVLYVTERCVFRLGEQGLTLTEVAPGIDIDRDILQRLPFTPAIQGPREMDKVVFRPASMGLRERMLDIRIEDRLSYDAASNTVYMDYAGMRIRSEADVKTIIEAVDRLLGPLGKRVHSVVNYERFSCDDDAFEAYMDAVKYVEKTYYLSVKRYTSGAFLRHKLGAGFAKRDIVSEVLATAAPGTPGKKIDRSDTGYTLPEFLAHAIALESEAADRYLELADMMESHGGSAVSSLFRDMVRFSLMHRDEITARVGTIELPKLRSWEFRWRTPPEAGGDETVDYLLEPFNALRYGRGNEVRAMEYYRAVAAESADAEVKRLAEEFAKEEAEHVAAIDRWLARTPKPSSST